MFRRIYQKLQTREGLFFLISLALIVAILVFILSYFGFGKYQKDITGTVTVSGRGEMNVSPDIAQFTFSVSRDATTIAEGRNQSAQVTNPLIDQLKSAGISEKDIKTESFNAYPKYENKTALTYPWNPGNPVIVGYTVTTNYSVKVRDLDKVSDVAKIITDAGISTIDGPQFTVEDIEKLKNQVRGDAVADVRAQARVLARQLGVRLVDIIDFQEGDIGYPLYANKGLGAGMSLESDTPELLPGATKVETSVTITYRIR